MSKKPLTPQSPLPAPPAGARLLGALLTSYRPVSPHFLLRDVLPVLLQLNRAESGDNQVDRLFVGATIAALEKVPDKITVITSCVEYEDGAAALPWLDRYVVPYTTGRDDDCVQHAKLWLVHWDTPAGQQLQITVSSTNLTADAFSGQLQAGWTVCLPLAEQAPRRPAHAALRGFLEQLGRSAHCAHATARFSALLERCPDVPGSHFITSIPQQRFDRKQARLLAGPRQEDAGAKAAKTGVHIVCPSLGDWNSKADIDAWCKMVGVTPQQVNLYWPEASHPWVTTAATLDPGQWKMPARAFAALQAAGVQLWSLPEPAATPLFLDGAANDQRWCHAKLYSFTHGLLLGSHNWSKAAWGLPDGSGPRNFELSVFIEKQALPMNTRRWQLINPALMERPLQDDPPYWLRWAQATLTAAALECRYRLRAGVTAQAQWHDGQDWQPFATVATAGAHQLARQPLAGATPVQVRLVCQDQQSHALPIADLRPGNPAALGVAPDMQILVEDLELEAYGGPLAQPGTGNARKQSRRKVKAAASDADYGLEWLLTARCWQRVVDTWLANRDGHGAEVHAATGLRLAAALHRKAQDGPGAALASEELRHAVAEIKPC